MNPTKILIIEDNYDNLALMKLLLERWGKTVITAMDGHWGLKLARAEHPDLILLDIDMPVMNGWQVIHEVKQDPQLRHIPILVVTAHLLPNERKKVLAAGGDGYVSKPFRVPELLKEIENCLN